MKRQEYFAVIDFELVVSLGEHDTIMDAFEVEPGNTTGVYSRDGLVELHNRIGAALGVNDATLNGRMLHTSDDKDAQYLYIERDGAPGQIHVKAESEGFVVDIWTYDGIDNPNCVATTAALYTELEPE